MSYGLKSLKVLYSVWVYGLGGYISDHTGGTKGGYKELRLTWRVPTIRVPFWYLRIFSGVISLITSQPKGAQGTQGTQRTRFAS